MGDVVRRDSEEKKLSQLKKYFIPHFRFFTQKGFSAYALLFVGTGVFPALPNIDTEALTRSGEAAEVSPVIFQEEVCRWQKDFSFFSRLIDGDITIEKETPCVEGEAILKTGVVEKQPVPNVDLIEAIRIMTTGYPMEVMAPAISAYDRQVAGLIVGIAKKESNWGKRVPVDASGADCFNYWGFKGAGSRGVAMGHGCFGSPEEAVQAVGNRIAELVAKRQTSEPKNMIIWKCGSSCSTHSPESVRKWVADVDLYYRQIVKTD